jgi:hypothetical protein
VQNNPLFDLAKKYNVALSIPTDESYTYEHESTSEEPEDFDLWFDKKGNQQDQNINFQGELIENELVLDVEEIHDEMWEHILATRNSMQEDVSVADFIKKYGLFEKILALKTDYPDEPESRFQEVVNILLHDFEGYNNSTLDQLSTKYDCYKGFPGGDKVVIGGYSSIFDSILAELKQFSTVKLLLEHRVDKIQWKQGSVLVRGTDLASNQPFSISGTRAVVTVPLNILKKNIVTFEPSLSKEKLEVFAKLEEGLLDKVILILKKPIVESKYRWVNVKNDKIAIDFLNLQYYYPEPLKYPVLMGFVHGPEARMMEDWTDEQVSTQALEMLSQALGFTYSDVDQVLVKGIMTRWAKDPFALGSYTFMKVGVDSGAMMDEYSKSVEDTLFFAGEGSIRENYATVHGAYLSGLREAEKILQSLK